MYLSWQRWFDVKSDCTGSPNFCLFNRHMSAFLSHSCIHSTLSLPTTRKCHCSYSLQVHLILSQDLNPFSRVLLFLRKEIWFLISFCILLILLSCLEITKIKSERERERKEKGKKDTKKPPKTTNWKFITHSQMKTFDLPSLSLLAFPSLPCNRQCI